MPPDIVYAREGETIEQLCFVACGGFVEGYLEACLRLNPTLLATVFLSAHTPVRLPYRQAVVQKPRELLRLFSEEGKHGAPLSTRP